MSLTRVLFLAAVLGLGYKLWSGHQQEAQLQAGTASSPSGFVPVAMPGGARSGVVMVFAPVNCPSDAARRADELAAGLTRTGIAVQRSSHFSTETTNPSAEQQAQLQRTVAVLNGGIPAVFFNGMGKANPTLDEVVAQVRAPR
ncbi:conserved hypothetical protein [Stutzerimonas stutzeri A1501]|uniref:Uncharacterized protein n=1 Tax=Stutzerimonas stutzeri (strain A1501) TaxID=379731 RepID=A4VQ59_STUS1|nr:hypothetical protein [Stutzerimonas stutzeri]ABP81110.1 conserved hypothetical protein [Stutzerimonas stutzeri A1501]UWG59874.1 hypothetical protein NDR94_17680 [Stutzerimonas stutzeri]